MTYIQNIKTNRQFLKETIWDELKRRVKGNHQPQDHPEVRRAIIQEWNNIPA